MLARCPEVVAFRRERSLCVEHGVLVLTAGRAGSSREDCRLPSLDLCTPDAFWVAANNVSGSRQTVLTALGTHAACNRSRRATRSCEHITAQSAAQHTVMGARTRTREMRGDDPNVDAVRCRGGRKMHSNLFGTRKAERGARYCSLH